LGYFSSSAPSDSRVDCGTVTMVIYARRKVLRIRDGLIMATCITAMGLVASQLVRYVPDAALQRGFGVLLIALAVLVWFAHLGETDNPERFPSSRRPASVH
jgi:uncharacterized membrane protein YfcA